ncbi:MAG: hypothetical protein Q7R50_01595 [Dehalococcoidales bacterium]|nr:hypothetical protein [Dehalococcoidales bacterium]
MNDAVKVLSSINLGAQCLLIIVLAIAAYFSIKKKDLKTHCRILRIAVPFQILTITVIMFPSLLGYLRHEHKGWAFNTELLVHHTLGIVVIAAWIYANLVLLKKIQPFIGLRFVMRMAFASWIFSFLLGVYVYSSIYGIT